MRDRGICVDVRMRLEVLISCMQQENTDIVKKTGVTTDALVINQTDCEKWVMVSEKSRMIRMICTTERGISKSRNMALKNARGQICLFCDDDEILRKNYADIILKAFGKLPDAAVIAFDVENKKTRLRRNPQRLGYLGSLKIASYQLALKRQTLLDEGILFDEKMGAGSGNGAQEENKFLWDCLKKGLAVYYVPKTIGKLCSGTSTWFFGYDEKFFYQRGGATRHMMGLALSVLYGIYYIIAKRKEYGKDLSCVRAAAWLFRGIVENPIEKAADS